MDNRILQIVLRAKDEASKVLKQVGDQTQGLSKLFRENFKEAGLMSGAVLAGFAVAAKAAIGNAASYEQNRIAFESMLGSADDARKLLSKVSDFAKQTPFELPQVVEGSKRLLAYNIEAEKIIPTFKMLGDIASGVGTDKLPQLITAFGQVQAKGKLMGTELLQFTEAGVGLGQELQKSFGVTREELEKMISSGDVTADQVTEALQRMTGEGGLFFQGMERQSKSFNGIMSNIKDSFGQFVREAVGITEQGDIREGSLFYYIRLGAEKLLPIVEKAGPKVAEFIEKITKNKDAVLGIVGALAGLALLAAGAFIVAFAGPIAVMIAFAAAGALIAIGIGKLIDLFKEWQPKVKQAWDAAQEFFSQLPERVGQTVDAVVDWFRQLPERVQAFLYDLFWIKIPYAVGFAAGWLSTAIPAMVGDVIRWFQELPGRAAAIFDQMRQWIADKVTAAWSWLSGEVSAWPGRVGGFLSALPGRVRQIFNDMKDAAIGKIVDLWNALTGWWDKIRGIFDNIRGAAEKAVGAVQRGIDAGRNAGMRFAEGGWVPYTGNAVVHAGEFVLSRDMLAGRQPIPAEVPVGKGGGVTINMGGVHVNSMADVNSMAYRLGFHLQTAGNL